MMSKIVSDVKWMVVLAVAVVGLLGACGAGVVQAQDVAKAGKAAVRVDKKEAPKEIAIPELRTDKVLLLQEQAKTADLELTALVEKFKASEEFKKLETRQKAVGDKLVVELTAALKGAGVEEKDFGNYSYNRETLKFTLKEAEPVKK